MERVKHTSLTDQGVPSRRLLPLLLASGGLIAVAGTASSAAEIAWVGGASPNASDFNNPANWSGGSMPAYFNEAANNVNGDVTLFDGSQAGLVNKTPTMTAPYGTGVDNSTTWGLLGVRFTDSGWTLDTGANTLYVSRRLTDAISSEGTSGVNTINGTLRLGGGNGIWAGVNVADGGTLRLNANVGNTIDGTTTSGGSGLIKHGGGTLELNTTGTWNSGLVVKAGTVKLFSETAGGITGDGTGGFGSQDNRGLTLDGGTFDINGANSKFRPNTIKLASGATLTNSSTSTTSTVSTRMGNGTFTWDGEIAGNLNLFIGVNETATVIIDHDNTYTGTTTINQGGGGAGARLTTVIVKRDVLPNQASPFGNASSAIQLIPSGGFTSNAALLTDGAITIGRDINVGTSSYTNVNTVPGTRTIGAADTQVGDSTFSGTIKVGMPRNQTYGQSEL